ncbi:MAG: hypothetical protein ACD_62C00130G0004 [uncultured bacterium]|nr:MAG: hypothetical protein ACD_62C00130G0004 [uncultured bacterium]
MQAPQAVHSAELMVRISGLHGTENEAQYLMHFAQLMLHAVVMDWTGHTARHILHNVQRAGSIVGVCLAMVTTPVAMMAARMRRINIVALACFDFINQ